jgi:RNA polymerase sigma-70 factor (ECF subfamily)
VKREQNGFVYTIERPENWGGTMGEIDQQLLDEFYEAGDEMAFVRLVNRYSALVYSASYRVLKNHAQAEEVCQETFFKLLNHSRQITTSLSGWLYQTAVRLSIDMVRSDSARRNREQHYAHEQAPHQQVGTWKELEHHLDEALEQLPEDQRDLLVEHFLQGISQREIALKHGWSTPTTSRYIKAAVEKLREKLHDQHLEVIALPLLLGEYSHMIVPPELAMTLGKMALASGYAHASAGGAIKVAVVYGSFNKFWLVLSIALAIAIGWALWLSIDYQPTPKPASSQVIDLFGETTVPSK